MEDVAPSTVNPDTSPEGHAAASRQTDPWARLLGLAGILALLAVCVGTVIVCVGLVRAGGGLIESDRQAREAAKATVDARDFEATTFVQAIGATATARIAMPLIMLDDFNSNENKWHTGLLDSSSLDLRRTIVEGIYRWEAEMDDGFAQTDRVDVDSVRDFYLAVNMRRVSGSARSSAGVIFRVDYRGYYLFSVSSRGRFAFFLNEGGDWTPIIGWVDSEFIVPAGVNRLEVSAENRQFAFFINGHLVAQIEETRRETGAVGLVMEGYEAGEAIYEFDNFELRAPAPASP